MRAALTAFTVALVVALGVGDGLLYAQAPGQEQQAPGWIFTPSIRFGGSWDDNILLANPGDNPPGDYATPVSPGADLEYRGRRTRLTSGYEGSFLLYRTFDELNSSEQRLRARLEHRASPRLTVYADENFAQVPTTDSLVLSGIPFYRVGSRMNAASGGFEATLTRHTTFEGKYSLSTVAFDVEDALSRDLQGGRAHEVAVGVGRALSRRLTLGGSYEARRAVISRGDDRFDSHTGSMTVQYDATPTVTLSGLLGVSRLGAGLLHPAKTGPAVRAGITRRARSFVLSAVYQRSFIPSFGFGGTFQNEEWQASAHVPFAGTRGFVDGSVARFDNDPLEPTQPSLRSVWLSGTLGYWATRWLSVEAFYGQSQQNSQRAGGDLGRHQVGFRMRAAKTMRLAK